MLAPSMEILALGGLAVVIVLGGAVWLFIQWLDRDRDEPRE
jgi:hypothetical protein